MQISVQKNYVIVSAYTKIARFIFSFSRIQKYYTLKNANKTLFPREMCDMNFKIFIFC